MSSPDDKFELALKQFDALIRNGEPNLVRPKLQAMAQSKIPRKFRLALASLARRTDLSQVAVRLLNSTVRPAGGKPSNASDEEKAEYAASLTKLGAHLEAKKLLTSVDPVKTPDALLFLAFTHFACWEYDKSIPILERYVASPNLPDYKRLVGKLNLGAAYVHEREDEKAIQLFCELREELSKLSLHRLLSNTLSLWSELEIERRNFSEAKRLYTEAARYIKDPESMDSFYIGKRKAMAMFLTDPSDGTAVKAMMAFREMAQARKHWESVRDCDLHLAVHRKDEALLSFVYFGTPYDHFRERLQKEWGKQVEMPDMYHWKLGTGESATVIDLLGVERKGKESLKPGQVLFRLAATLSSDFYRPFRLAEIHAAIFPNEFYNPETSPLRVHQAMFRFRHWLLRHCPSLEVEEVEQTYRWRAKKPLSLVIHRTSVCKSVFELMLDKLEAQFEGTFSRAEAEKFLTVSSPWIRKVLQAGMSQGRLIREGDGSMYRYRFAANQARSKAA